MRASGRNGSKPTLAEVLANVRLRSGPIRAATTDKGALRTFPNEGHDDPLLTVRLNSSRVLPSTDAPSRYERFSSFDL